MRSKPGSISPRQARGKLSTLEQAAATSLQEHSCQIKQLVPVAYDDLLAAYRVNMSRELFSGTVNPASLQRHLLVALAAQLNKAVKARTEFFQIDPDDRRTANI